MINPFSIKPRTIFLGGYAVSLLFSSIQLLPGFSLPFLLASLLFLYKTYDIIINNHIVKLQYEGTLIAALYFYLITAEIFFHNASIYNNYFISLGLNCVMMLILADEFRRDPTARSQVMHTYVSASVVVSILISLGIMTLVPETGRVTFLGLNQNELASVLLVAYCGISVEFIRDNPAPIAAQSIGLFSAIAILNAMLSTGTRFTLVAVIAVMLVLAVALLSDRCKSRRKLIYISINAVFIICKTLGFSPMYDRLLPSNIGNNLTDLGGRLDLWSDAFDAFRESSLIGLGYNGYKEFVLARERFFELPHNLFFEILAVSGITGIIILLMVGLFICIRSAASSNRAVRLEVLIWGIPLFILLSMINIYHTKIFWLLLAYFITINFSMNSHTQNFRKNSAVTL